MNRILNVFLTYPSGIIKKTQLYFLFKIAAKAFGCASPAIWHLNSADALHKFALFTKEQAEKALAEGKDTEKIKSVLFAKAFGLAARTCHILKLSDPADIFSICKLLYKNIRIDVEGRLPGEIIMKSCYFSDFYTSRVCHLMSALDEGIIAGLFNGGRLTFAHRITEGSPCCRAFFTHEENDL